MKKHGQKLKDLICTITGGANIYKGKEMRKAHKGINILPV